MTTRKKVKKSPFDCEITYLPNEEFWSEFFEEIPERMSLGCSFDNLYKEINSILYFGQGEILSIKCHGKNINVEELNKLLIKRNPYRIRKGKYANFYHCEIIYTEPGFEEEFTKTLLVTKDELVKNVTEMTSNDFTIVKVFVDGEEIDMKWLNALIIRNLKK